MAQNKFPEIISQLRKKRGLSQKEAAGDLGISAALLSHYEKGIRECNLDFLMKVSDYYGVSCDYLLGHSAGKTSRTRTSQRTRLFVRSLETLMLIFDRVGDENFEKQAGNYLKFTFYRLFGLFDGIVDGLNFDGRERSRDFALSTSEISYIHAKEAAENLTDSTISLSPSALRYPDILISEVETELKEYDLL